MNNKILKFLLHACIYISFQRSINNNILIVFCVNKFVLREYKILYYILYYTYPLCVRYLVKIVWRKMKNW